MQKCEYFCIELHLDQDFSYLNSFSCKLGSGGAALKRPGLVQLDETFVVLKSNSSCNT